MFEWIMWKFTGTPTTKMKLDIANKTVHDLMEAQLKAADDMGSLYESNSRLRNELNHRIVQLDKMLAEINRLMAKKQSSQR